MEDNEGALVGGAVGVVSWGDAMGSGVRFLHNDVRDCHSSGAGTGGGGLGVLYLGAQSVSNEHTIANNNFVNCSGGSAGSYTSDNGGGTGGFGGAGGFAVVYAGYSLLGAVVATRNTHAVSGNNFASCTGGSNNTCSNSKNSPTGNSGGGGGAGGFAVIFAIGSNIAGEASGSSSDHNSVSISSNTLVKCKGGYGNAFSAAGFATSAGGGGGGGFTVIFANSARTGSTSSDNNDVSIGNNVLVECVGGSYSKFGSSNGNAIGGGGGGGGFSVVFANCASHSVATSSGNSISIGSNTLSGCTGGSKGTFKSTASSIVGSQGMSIGGGGGGGGFAVIFANGAGNHAGANSASNSNNLSMGNNTLSGCTGGSDGTFTCDAGYVCGGGGGAGGAFVTFASGAIRASASHNTVSATHNSFTDCTGGNNSTFGSSGSGGAIGGGGGAGGVAVVFANGVGNYWQVVGDESRNNGNSVSIDENVLSACTGGSSSTFSCFPGSTCGSGGGAGGALVAFSSASTRGASTSSNAVSVTHNTWRNLSVAITVSCPDPGALCGTAGALAVLFTAPGTSVVNTTVNITDNHVEKCSAGGVVDSSTAGSGTAAGVTVLYFQTAPSLSLNTHALEGNRFVSGTAAQGGSAVRLLLGSGKSGNNASFVGNTIANNTITCDEGQTCAGGSVVVDGGRATFESDIFTGNVGGDRGTTADLFVAGSSSSKDPLALSNVIFQMTANTTQPKAKSITGVTVGNSVDVSGDATFSCPLGWEVTDTSSVFARSFGCQRCAPLTYLVQKGTLELGVGRIGTCKPCPFGGDCTGGGDAMNASAGYWGRSDDGNVGFTLCPSGLCCPDGDCAWNEACSPLHRDNAVPLCGACAIGYSATVGSSACRATSACNDARWFVPGLLLIVLLWTQFVLVAGASSPPGGSSSVVQVAGVAQLVLYFYQMAQLLPVGQTQVGEALALVSGLFNMQLHAPSAGGFTCPFPGLTTLQEIALHYLTPGLVGGMLLLRYKVECCARRQESSKRAVAGNDGNRYARAVPTLLATAFTTLLTTTFKLLHCDEVGGHGVVFRAASVPCDQWWRTPLFLVVGALLLPVAATLAARASPAMARWWAERPWRRTEWAKAVVKKLRAPFVGGCWHWAAVLALQRLVTVAVYAFVRETASRALFQVLVAGMFLVLHIGSRPFTHAAVHHVQTALLVVLALVAVLNAPLASLQTGAFATLSSNPMDGIKYQLKAAEAVLLLAPGALFVTAALIGMWLERAMLVAALARNIVWFMRSTMWLCTMPCRGRAGRRTAWAGDQNELNMPLLNPTGDGDAHAGVTARESGGNRINSKLITNDRGIRLAFTSHV
jgi:hypothetical protein